MKIKNVAILIFFLTGSYIIYWLSQPVCHPCYNNQMQIIRECSPVPSAYTTIYRRLTCFCDNSQDWKKLGFVIRSLNYYKDIYGEKYPENMFGTKNIPCSDDELQVDVFDDNDVFLYIVQDTTKIVYDGALKKIIINDMVTYKIGILDVDKENRKVTHNSKKATIKYSLDYNELNSKSLIKFQQAIHYDSSYQKRFKNVEYQLINKETSRHDASIRYEDFGERFYLDVF